MFSVRQEGVNGSDGAMEPSHDGKVSVWSCTADGVSMISAARFEQSTLLVSFASQAVDSADGVDCRVEWTESPNSSKGGTSPNGSCAPEAVSSVSPPWCADSVVMESNNVQAGSVSDVLVAWTADSRMVESTATQAEAVVSAQTSWCAESRRVQLGATQLLSVSGVLTRWLAACEVVEVGATQLEAVSNV